MLSANRDPIVLFPVRFMQTWFSAMIRASIRKNKRGLLYSALTIQICIITIEYLWVPPYIPFMHSFPGRVTVNSTPYGVLCNYTRIYKVQSMKTGQDVKWNPARSTGGMILHTYQDEGLSDPSHGGQGLLLLHYISGSSWPIYYAPCMYVYIYICQFRKEGNTYVGMAVNNVAIGWCVGGFTTSSTSIPCTGCSVGGINTVRMRGWRISTPYSGWMNGTLPYTNQSIFYGAKACMYVCTVDQRSCWRLTRNGMMISNDGLYLY